MNRIEYIQEFQKKLAQQFPKGFQHTWTKFIFHFSDIHSIISILNSGKLYSREKAINLGLMENDNANSNVIDNTVEQYKSYVRFYFGAKTPTQYMNEGVKLKQSIQNNAHCPVPVFLLFDFVRLLSIENVSFSNGNIAVNNPEIYSDAQDLNRLEFTNIYHHEALPNNDFRKHVMYCRNAEVLVPHEVDVYDYLRYVYVRSEAERETLLYGLDDEIKKNIRDRIIVFSKDGLFFAKELFINSVKLQNSNIVVNLSLIPFNQYKIVLYGEDLESKKAFKTNIEGNITQSTFAWHLRDHTFGNHLFYMKIEIDGHLVYQNILQQINDDIF